MSRQSNMVSGLLNINKPPGMTSHDVVARVRKLSGQRKVGHTGTLDPMATGVLLVCLGQATRLIEYLQGSPKKYRATVRFGVTTDTLDAEGQIVEEQDPSPITGEQLQLILPKFQGEIEQIPPVFSALKKDGQPLYKWARAGQPVTPAPRRVTVYSITWVDWQHPDLTLDIVCSSGTYIRSLARDLGNAAAVGAHLSALSRTANGRWSLPEAVSLKTLIEEASQADQDAWQRHLQPLEYIVAHLPKVTLPPEAVQHIRHGRAVELKPAAFQLGAADHSNPAFICAYTPTGNFLAILTRAESNDKLWQPKKVFLSGG